MAVFKFDEVDQFVNEGSDNKINFLKLQDDGWYAKVRFMYGPGEIFEGVTVHNVSEDPRKPRFVPCLRGVNEPLESCPLCVNGSKIAAQFFIPVYVHSIVSNVRGVESEQPVNQVMLFQRGTTFKGALQSVIRQTQSTGKPIVSSVFNLVRNGKQGDMKTSYSVEYCGTDETTLESLPPRVQVLGSYILPDVDYETMLEKYVKGAAGQTTPVAIQPRTLSAATFGNNTVVTSATPAMPAMPTMPTMPTPAVQPIQPINANQAPVQAPNISNNVPF